jgi:hypothetical protein
MKRIEWASLNDFLKLPAYRAALSAKLYTKGSSCVVRKFSQLVRRS